jgi:hypothetical protein
MPHVSIPKLSWLKSLAQHVQRIADARTLASFFALLNHTPAIQEVLETG